MLRVEYVPDSRRARLITDAVSGVWNRVRRICEETTDEVINTSATSLTVPWWAFLAAWHRIGMVLRAERTPVEVDTASKRLLQQARERLSAHANARNADPKDTATVRARLSEAGFQRELTAEQARNIGRLAVLPAGASFSVPGAGKTTEALATYTLRRTPDMRLLVVSPKNAFAPWEEQIAACFGEDHPNLVRLQGGRESIQRLLDEDPDMSVIGYQQLPIVRDLLADHMTRHPTFMILDESHRMKRGQEGTIGSAILSLSHLPHLKLILSGTPLPNSIADLCPQLLFLYPELQVNDVNVTDLVKPIYVRTVKQELGLREPIRQEIPVPLNPGQRHLYDLVRSEYARQMEGLRAGDRRQLRAIGRAYMRLLQLVSNPALLASVSLSRPDLLQDALREGDSPKMQVACALARDLAARGHKSIIWSTFVENVEVLAARLADLGADFIHGGVETGSDEDESTREAKVRRFHDDDSAFVLVANPAAASESISLHTVCHHAIYLDRTYNAGHYIQSEDRIHRLGLAPDQETTIYLLVAPGTIDESVGRRLDAKASVMAQVLNDPSLVISPVTVGEDLLDEELDAEDVEDLLRHLRGES